MQAIFVRYRGQTQHTGSRFVVTCYGQTTMRVPYDHALGPDENYDAALRAMCVRGLLWGAWKGAHTHRTGERVYVKVSNFRRQRCVVIR